MVYYTIGEAEQFQTAFSLTFSGSFAYPIP